MNRADRELIEATEGLLARVKVFKKTALDAKDRGDTWVELHVQEVWEPSDEAALQRYEAALARAKEQPPLPFESGDAACSPT
jgi:hypothetical protein